MECIDLSAKLVWLKTDTNSNWNNSGAADPATGTGGASYSTTGALFPGFTVYDTTGDGGAYINAGGWSFLLSMPSGFSAWDSTAYTAGAISGTHAPTTFNPADKSTDTVLSGGNLTAAWGASQWNAVRTGSKWTSGLVYFEVTMGPSLSSVYYGIDDGTTSMTEPVTPNSTNLIFFGIRSDGVAVYCGNNVFTWLPGGTSSNHVVGVAMDLGRGMFWAKDITASSNWNNNASSNPVGEILPGPISSVGTTAYMITSLFQPGDQMTLNTGATAFTGSVPTGFVAWDAASGSGGGGGLMIRGMGN
jgi:hypothetical protein